MDFEIRELSKETGEYKYNYLYKLLENTYEDNKVYGIEIIRNDIKEGNIINIESDSIKLISPKRDKVVSMLDLLFRGEVSPIHLVDIIGEAVDNSVFDF